MSLGKSNIDYLPRLNGKDGYVWNVAVGGEPAYGSPGEMEALAKRIGRAIGCKLCESFTPHMHFERLGDVTPRQQPKRIGVGFMTDLFGPWNWEVCDNRSEVGEAHGGVLCDHILDQIRPSNHRFIIPTRHPENIPTYIEWPPNVCLLITCTNQEEAIWNLPVALERIKGDALVAANLEPLTEATDLRLVLDGPAPFVLSALDWVIVGGMSGPLATPMHPGCVRGVRDQCVEAGVPFYFKQWGAWAPVRTIERWPEETYQAMPAIGCRTGDRLVLPDGSSRGFISCCTEAPCAKAERGMRRVGKREAGHVLDGREWRQMPEALLLPGEGPAQTPR